ncbi:heme-binding protein [Lachnospiraceae bacterium 47-T17]|mgnify:CR=1 FL=1
MNELEIQKIVESLVQAKTTARHGAPTRTCSDITLAMAKELIAAVEQRAAQMGVRAVIAVANRGANPVAVHCMDDSYIASFDVAFQKAYTCAALKMPTTALKELCQPGGELYGIQHTNQGRIVIFGGGIPILTEDGTCIGGLGVSGGTEAEDTALAEFARTVVQDILTSNDIYHEIL